MAEGRLLRNSLLSTTPSQTISTSFQAQEKQAPVPPPGGRGWGAEQSLAFREDIQKQADSIQQSTPEPKYTPALMQLLKSPVYLRGKERRSRIRMCSTVVSCLPVAWEGCMGHLTPGNSGSRSRRHRLQNIPGAKMVPDSAPAVTLNCRGLSPSPRRNGWGAS